MAKHLLKFNNEAEYNAATINKPAVSWCVEENTVKYDPYVPPFKGKVRITYSDGEVYEVAANASTTLTQAEVTGGTQAKTNIVTAEVGTAVTSIGTDVFNGCTSLTSVTIPDSVTSIGNNAFYMCTILTSIDIPDSVTSIGNNVFSYCSSLTSIVIPDGVTSINGGVFSNCSSLTSIVIPDGVTSIGGSAFYGCSSLTSIVIPSGVTSIGVYAFNQCKSLTSITIKATTPPTLGSGALSNTKNCPIYVPSASVETYKSASGWSDYASRIQAIPS